MSYEKRGGRSLAEKKSELHLASWRDEIKQSIGSSSRELGIYNRQEVIKRLRGLYETLPKMKEFEFLQALKEISNEVGVYIVGGSVRDAVLEKPAKDIDLIVKQIEPAELVDILLKYGKVVFDRNPNVKFEEIDPAEIAKILNDSYGVIKFNPKQTSLPEPIDITFPRQDDYTESGQSGILGIRRDMKPRININLSIVEELKRRDLTINAMAVNLIDGEIVDPFDGIEDIVRRKIRSVGRPEDRILNEDLSRGFGQSVLLASFPLTLKIKLRKQ